eukprot:2747237-Heterocapsa_arctica.AAC.1
MPLAAGVDYSGPEHGVSAPRKFSASTVWPGVHEQVRQTLSPVRRWACHVWPHATNLARCRPPS